MRNYWIRLAKEYARKNSNLVDAKNAFYMVKDVLYIHTDQSEIHYFWSTLKASY
jgi:hypothetical protein